MVCFYIFALSGNPFFMSFCFYYCLLGERKGISLTRRKYYNVTRFSIYNVRTTGVMELTKRKIRKLLLVSVLERMHTKVETWSLNNSMVYNF